MTSSNGSTIRVTGPLCGEFNGHRWIPLTKASDDIFQFIALYFHSNVTDIYSQQPDLQWSNIGSDNALVPNWLQAIIWASDGPIYWLIYATFDFDE